MKEPKKTNKPWTLKLSMHHNRQWNILYYLTLIHLFYFQTWVQSGSFIKWLAAAEDLNRASLAVQNFGNYWIWTAADIRSI